MVLVPELADLYGGLEIHFFAYNMESSHTGSLKTSNVEVSHFSFMCFSFVNLCVGSSWPVGFCSHVDES